MLRATTTALRTADTSSQRKKVRLVVDESLSDLSFGMPAPCSGGTHRCQAVIGVTRAQNLEQGASPGTLSVSVASRHE